MLRWRTFIQIYICCTKVKKKTVQVIETLYYEDFGKCTDAFYGPFFISEWQDPFEPILPLVACNEYLICSMCWTGPKYMF